MAIEVDLKCEVVEGASTFIELTDTPSSYTGQAGKKVVVNGDEDGLELIEESSGGVYSGLGEWSYNSTPGTPNAGEFSFNNANPQLANKLYISYTDANSLNKIFSLTFFNGVDYKVAFSGTEDGSKFYSCAITLVGFTGTYLELDIAPYDSYNLVDGDKLGLFIQSKGQEPLLNGSGTTANGNKVDLGGTLSQSTTIQGNNNSFNLGTFASGLGYSEINYNDGSSIINRSEGPSGFGDFIDFLNFGNTSSLETYLTFLNVSNKNGEDAVSYTLTQAGANFDGNYFGQGDYKKNAGDINAIAYSGDDDSFNYRLAGAIGEYFITRRKSSDATAITGILGYSDGRGLTVKDTIDQIGFNYDNAAIDEANVDYSNVDHVGSLHWRNQFEFQTGSKTPTSIGRKGEKSYDANYEYTCIDTNTWVRKAIETSW